jgi:hypothetical protein
MEAKSDADLPAGIASVLPADPYDQLEIAHRIMSKAIASRADELGTSAKLLMGQIEDRDASIAQLEQRVAELRLAVEQNDAKLSTVLAHQVLLPDLRFNFCNLASVFVLIFGLIRFVLIDPWIRVRS